MKKLILISLFSLIISGCSKTEDNTDYECTSNCTTISGKFVSANNEPVPNIKVSLKYKISGGELGGGYTRKIVTIQSDKNGNYYKNFYIKDSELGKYTGGYFLVGIDDSNIDVNKYIRTNNLIGTTTTDIGFAIFSITKRDTIIDNSFYIPKKAYIKINLNNFVPQQPDDSFEVQTLYPFGSKVEEGHNTYLDSEYSTGFSGYQTFIATKENNSLKVFGAENENNIIRVIKRKNGVSSSEEFPVYIPKNNTIELTYNF